MNNIRVKSIWIILVIIACVVLFVYKFQTSEEDKEIQHEKERMVQYVIEKVELHDKEEFKKIKVIEFKKKLLNWCLERYYRIKSKIQNCIKRRTIW